GNPDRELINVSEPYELRDWADKFGVTNVRLKAVVNIVGNSAKKVEAYLTKNK
ncbi:MAG: DUF3606 domain-containing protein, partial [Chitinophagaceae bacterium]